MGRLQPLRTAGVKLNREWFSLWTAAKKRWRTDEARGCLSISANDLIDQTTNWGNTSQTTVQKSFAGPDYTFSDLLVKTENNGARCP